VTSRNGTFSTKTRREYVRKVFERQCEFGLKNLETLIGLFGDRVQVALITGTDFGTQRGPFISIEAYRDLFKPFHRQVNDFIHRRTRWKTFIHSCGSVFQLIPTSSRRVLTCSTPCSARRSEWKPRV